MLFENTQNECVKPDLYLCFLFLFLPISFSDSNLKSLKPERDREREAGSRQYIAGQASAASETAEYCAISVTEFPVGKSIPRRGEKSADAAERRDTSYT